MLLTHLAAFSFLGGAGAAPVVVPPPTLRGPITDIATIWDTVNSRGDWAMSGVDLASGNDLVTAVLISLFTDRSAAPDDVIPDGTTDRRGWLGDLGEDIPIGSRLWLLDRAKQTPQVLKAAQSYIAEALEWLITDGVASSIDVYVEFSGPGMLGAQVTVHKPNAPKPTVLSFNWAWQGIS